MLRPRAIVASPLTAALFIYASLLIPGARLQALAQQSSEASSAERARGIQLYQQGDTDGALKELRAAVKQKKDDSEAWHYLGLAYSRKDKLRDARKAFEEAVKLRPDFALARSNLAYTLLDLNKLDEASREAQNALALDPANAVSHYVMAVVYMREELPAKALKEAEAALKARDNFQAAWLLRSQALFALSMADTQESADGALPPSIEESRAARRAMLKEAADSLDRYLRLEPNAANAEIWREQLETLRFYAGLKDKSKDENKVYSSKDSLTTKVRFLSKPAPPYTAAARDAGIEGTVVLQALFAADGKVKHILAIRSLPKGLTAKAIDAARQIKFIPATKDGHPVSMFYRIEYNFDLK